MIIELLRRSISRRSINRTSQARALRTRVSESTLCLLGQSNKAIGHESPIGPCVATPVDNCQACSFRKDGRRHHSDMKPQGRARVSPISTRRGNKTHGVRKDHWRSSCARSNSGAECNDNNGSAAEPTGEFFLLTFPFIGLVRSADLPSKWITSGSATIRELSDEVFHRTY
jgi:hypothetical protein